MDDFGGVSESEQAFESKGSRNSILVLLLASAIILLGFCQLRNWDRFALAEVPLQIKTWIGSFDVQDHEKQAKICLDRKYYDCVEQHYAASAAISKDLQKLLRLAKFQMSRSEYPEASKTLEVYFGAGGTDLDARYAYARVEGQLGNVGRASDYFEDVLASKPDVIQITVVQNYVKLLAQAGQTDRAMKLIKRVRKMRGDPKFMDQEFAQISSAPNARMPASN